MILKDPDHWKKCDHRFQVVGRWIAASAVSISGVVKSLGSAGKLRGFLICQSRGELDLNKNGFVVSRSVWRLKKSSGGVSYLVSFSVTLLPYTASASVTTSRDTVQLERHSRAYSREWLPPASFHGPLWTHGIIQRCDWWPVSSPLESCPGNKHDCSSFPIVFNLPVQWGHYCGRFILDFLV